jgi:hypothetical protein
MRNSINSLFASTVLAVRSSDDTGSSVMLLPSNIPATATILTDVSTDTTSDTAEQPETVSKPASKPAKRKPATKAAKPAETEKPASKPAETEKPASKPAEKPETEADEIADVSELRRIAANMQRTFDQQRVSVPIKPLAAFKPIAATANANGRSISVRQCAALAVAFTKQNRKLADGATIKRQFTFDAARYCIENGCSGDMLASGIIKLHADSIAGNETFILQPGATKAIIGKLGAPLLRDILPKAYFDKLNKAAAKA